MENTIKIFYPSRNAGFLLKRSSSPLSTSSLSPHLTLLAHRHFSYEVS